MVILTRIEAAEAPDGAIRERHHFLDTGAFVGTNLIGRVGSCCALM